MLTPSVLPVQRVCMRLQQPIHKSPTASNVQQDAFQLVQRGLQPRTAKSVLTGSIRMAPKRPPNVWTVLPAGTQPLTLAT